MEGSTVGAEEPSRKSYVQKQCRSQPVLPCLAIRRSLHVGRCVCVSEPAGFVNPQRIHTYSFSLPGCLCDAYGEQINAALSVAEPGHFLSTICAPRDLSSALCCESREDVQLLLRVLKKKCVGGSEEGCVEGYADEWLSGILDFGQTPPRLSALETKGGPQPSWEHLQKVLNSARMTF
jgi:hypothetical protein